MQTNESAKRILCFGDSNTWGWIPLTGERYPVNVRWTGVLQKMLGPSYEIIEEGLGARLATLDDPREGFVGKNALAYLTPCLDSQKPLDMIILMLGTPEFLKEKFSEITAKDVANGIKVLVEKILESKSGRNNSAPNILLMAPIIIDDSAEFVKKVSNNTKDITKRNKELPSLLEEIADEFVINFLNLSDFAFVSKLDGIHLDPETHKIVAEEIFKVVKEIL